MQLSVIIVNYNVRFFLEQCLLSVLKAGHAVEMEIIVVDNNSSDGSQQLLEPLFPQVRFYWLTDNLGFSSACNYGLQRARGSYILFLNPDTIVPEDCFQKTLAFIQSRPDAGAIGVRMIDGSGHFLKESKRGLPSASASFFKFSGLIKMFPQSSLFAQYYSGHLPEQETNRVDILSGAFMLISRDVLDKAGSFDEAFFMYGEDIDLSYRIRQAGFQNYYFSEVSIIHFKGESTQKADLKYLKSFYGAMSIFVRKHYPGTRSFLLRSLVQLVLLAKRCQRLFAKKTITKETGQPDLKQLHAFGDEQSYNHLLKILGPVLNGISYNNGKIKKRLDHVVLCEGNTCSFKAIIEQVNNKAMANTIWIHAEGSNSIVTSTSKKNNGTVIARDF